MEKETCPDSLVTGNSARSRWRKAAFATMPAAFSEVESAGPPRLVFVRPEAIAVMREIGAGYLSGIGRRTWEEFDGQHFDT